MEDQALIIAQLVLKPTVDQMVAAWLHAKSSLSHSQMTLDAYTESMAAFRDLLHQHGLDLDSEESLIASHAQYWAEYSALGNPISSATHNSRIHCISSFFVYARKMRWLPSNPMEMVEKRKVSHPHAARPLDKDMVEKALDSINRSTLLGKRDFAMLTLLLNTGRRVSEVMNLVCGDITVIGSTITVIWQRCKGGKVMYDNIDLLVARAIFEYLKAAYPDGWKAADSVWLSCSNHGKREPIGYRAIAGVCKKYLGTTKVHSTRHTAARKLQDLGAPLSLISKLLGHSNQAITSTYLESLHQGENPFARALAESYGLKEEE
jgi:site-specific recombinase XerD